MITSARIRDELRPAGLDWITALRAPQIRALLDAGAFQLSLFDERDLAEITAPEFPGERLVVCKNPLLADTPDSDTQCNSIRNPIGSGISVWFSCAAASGRMTPPSDASLHAWMTAFE